MRLHDVTVCAGPQPLRLTASQERKLFRGRTPEYIDKGKDACAYKVDGDVVKFTGNEKDAAAHLALARRPVEGVVRVTDVRPVTDWPNGPWAIRSKLVPRPSALAEVARTCAVMGKMDQAWGERFARSRRDPRILRRPMPIPRAAVDCVLLRAPGQGIAPLRALRFLRDLSETQARLARRTGIHWGDTSSHGNISEQDGRPVIIDMGSSLVPRRYFEALARTPELRGPAGSGLGLAVGGTLGVLAVSAALIALRR